MSSELVAVVILAVAVIGFLRNLHGGVAVLHKPMPCLEGVFDEFMGSRREAPMPARG